MPTLAEFRRLQLLNRAQPNRRWDSCTEKRQCIMCDRVFSGSEVDVRTRDHFKPDLRCPGCGSAPEMWVRLGNPLTDAVVWADWAEAMARSRELEEAVEKSLLPTQ
jgi:NAD-dependent SIR2 family protein deacetylase